MSQIVIPDPMPEDLAVDLAGNYRWLSDKGAGYVNHVDRVALSLIRRCVAAETARAALQAFKDWCHQYLDGKGVPHHPPGTHGAEGCRIGDRMDYVFALLADRDDRALALVRQRDAAEAEVKRLRGALEALFRAEQNEMVSRGLPLEWQPDSPMGQAEAALESTP